MVDGRISSPSPALQNELFALARVFPPLPLQRCPSLNHTTALPPPFLPFFPFRFVSSPRKVTVGFHNSAAAMPAPFMAIVEPRLMMRAPLEATWPRAFVALAGCLESYVAGRGFVPDLLRCACGRGTPTRPRRGLFVLVDRLQQEKQK